MGRGKSDNVKLPKGVELHGQSLRIVFRYKGVRCRETIGLPPTKKNILYAEGFRATVLHEIRTNTFVYHERFPDGSKSDLFDPNAKRVISISLRDLKDLYLKSRSVDVFFTTSENVEVSLRNSIIALGGNDVLVNSLRLIDIDALRVDLKSGRKNSTVNKYLSVMHGFFSYAKKHQFTDFDLAAECRPFPLDSGDDKPDPLEDEEFAEVIAHCRMPLYKHLFTFAVYTGLRIGEIAALSWADVDLHNGTICVRRNLTKYGFKHTKTYKPRTVHLLPPALDALKKMRLLSGLLPDVEIQVYQRDKTIIKKERVRFVFNPQSPDPSRKKTPARSWLRCNSIYDYWKSTQKRAGVRYRKFHQTRHTYACWTLAASGNPQFVADQLGHKDLAMLINVYGKWMPSKSDTETDRIWRAMNESR